jgi:CDP-diacylglycerol--glycerol-3-phosphate 3-phosphatidyltransferase
MVTVVIARELIISGLRDQLESMGAAFGADWLGKLKMTLQCAALIAIFVTLEVQARAGIESVPQVLFMLRDGLVWAMIVSTVLSGANYLLRLAIPSPKT